METICGWIKDCFEFFFALEVKEDLITKINQTSNNLSQDVKQDLISSIMENKPNQFVSKLNDKKNHIPQNFKDELMASMIRTSQVQYPKQEQIQPESTIELSNIALQVDTPPQAYARTDDDIEIPPLDDITLGDETEHIKIIHTGKIIPSDQFIPYNTPIYPMNNLTFVEPLDEEREEEREEEHRRFREFRQASRESLQTIHTGKIIPSDQFVPFNTPIKPLNVVTNWYCSSNWDNVIRRFDERILFRNFRQVKREELQTIHTGKIIPSDQFVPVHTPVRHYEIPVTKNQFGDWERELKRETDHIDLKFFIRQKREELQNKMEGVLTITPFKISSSSEPEIIHTGKIIPSGWFRPVRTDIMEFPIYKPTIQMSFERAFEREFERRNLRRFLKGKRMELNWLRENDTEYYNETFPDVDIRIRSDFGDIIRYVPYARESNTLVVKDYSIWNCPIHDMFQMAVKETRKTVSTKETQTENKYEMESQNFRAFRRMKREEMRRTRQDEDFILYMPKPDMVFNTNTRPVDENKYEVVRREFRMFRRMRREEMHRKQRHDKPYFLSSSCKKARKHNFLQTDKKWNQHY
jgi:hypothetical protein